MAQSDEERIQRVSEGGNEIKCIRNYRVFCG